MIPSKHLKINKITPNKCCVCGAEPEYHISYYDRNHSYARMESYENAQKLMPLESKWSCPLHIKEAAESLVERWKYRSL